MKEKGKTERAKISSLPQGCCGGTKKRDNFFFGRRVFLPTHLPQGRCRTPRQTEEHCFLVFVLVVFSPPPPPPPPPMVFVAPAFAVAVAMVCCFRKERERERRGQTTDGRLNNKKYGRERERERETRREKGQKSAPVLDSSGTKGEDPHAKGTFSRAKIAKKMHSLLPPTSSPLSFFLTKKKSLKTQRNKRDLFRSSRERTHLAFERSFAHFCVYLFLFFSRVFFPFVDKFRFIPRDLHAKEKEFVVVFSLFFSSSARHTRRACSMRDY